MQWNCDHMMAKKAELEDWLEKMEIDVALLQETKLRMEDVELRVRGYDVIRKDRRREGMSRLSRGGGLIILVKKGLRYQVLKVNEELEKGVSK